MISLGEFLIGAPPETAQMSAGVCKRESSNLASDLRIPLAEIIPHLAFGTDHISFSQQTSTRRPKQVFEARTKNDTVYPNSLASCQFQSPVHGSETPSQTEASFKFQRLSGTSADELQYLGQHRYEYIPVS